MRVTVTGAHGFLGQYTTRAFQEAGHEVQALGHYGHGEYADSDGDITNWSWISRKLNEFHPEVVVHLASLIDVPRSFKDPDWYGDVIEKGTDCVLSACGCIEARCIYVSSSEVYGPVRSGLHIAEDLIPNPNSPYASYKLFAERLARDCGAVILRPFNAFGAGQSLRAVLPSLARQAMDTGGHSFVIGNNSTRTWTHASDLARAFVAAATSNLTPGTPYNVGANWRHSVMDAATLMARKLGHEGPVVFATKDARPQTNEVPWLWCDAVKFQTATNWEPRVTFEAGLQELLRWQLALTRAG